MTSDSIPSINDGVDDLLAELSAQAARARTTVTPAERVDYLRGLVTPFDRLPVPRTEPVESVECDGYRRDRVVLEVLPGVRFSTYVLVPDQATGPRPAVLAVHGHGFGSRQISGMLPDGSTDPLSTDLYGHFAVQLVRRGLVVVAPDVVGFGERMTDLDQTYDADTSNSCFRLATNLIMNGRTVTGLRVAELIGVLDHLTTRPDVDADRIGTFGHSGGALWSMITAALDPRIRAAVLCGFPNTFATSFLAVHHCACNFLPGLLPIAEQPDLLELLAPRPLFLESGADDPIFPAAGFRTALAQVTTTYATMMVADRLRSDLVPGVTHAVTGRESFDWLASQLTNEFVETPEVEQ